VGDEGPLPCPWRCLLPFHGDPSLPGSPTAAPGVPGGGGPRGAPRGRGRGAEEGGEERGPGRRGGGSLSVEKGCEDAALGDCTPRPDPFPCLSLPFSFPPPREPLGKSAPLLPPKEGAEEGAGRRTLRAQGLAGRLPGRGLGRSVGRQQRTPAPPPLLLLLLLLLLLQLLLVLRFLRLP